jgi:phosphoglycolate phosphatase
MHDGVIFDLDGTLADTLGDITASINHALVAHGLPTHEQPAIRGFIGDGLRLLAERAAGSADPALIEPVIAAFRDHYREHLLDTSRPYAGVPELLAALAERGVRLAVLSNKPHEPTCRIVAELFPEISFAAVQGQLPGVPKKPDPQPALALATALAAAPARCLLVGDSAVDMQTGRAAGMIPVGVSWGFRDPAELLAAGATQILQAPAELLTLIP